LIKSLLRAAGLLATLTGLAAGQSATAATSQSRARAPGDTTVRIMLITIGQGDVVWELFGHNAIWVHDPASPVDSVYNWGVFDFRTPGFIPRFLAGDMRYTMDAQTIGTTILYYQYLRRRMWVQELNLTSIEKRAVIDFIRWNYRPENRQYRYNYYLDNCSTRVRDVIDRVLGGQLRAYLQSISTQETYRSHSLRLMQSAPFLVTGVEMALGSPTDKPLSADQASFLPVQLMEFVKGFKADGGTRPLVLREWMLNDPVDRGPEPSTIPALWKWHLPIGLGLAALILVLWFGVRARKTTATVIAIVAGLIGILGTIITLLVTVTDHVAAHGNQNLWMLNPIWLVVAVAVPMLLVRQRGKVGRWAAGLGVAVALCAALTHFVGLSHQPNWDIIGLLLPAQMAIALVALRSRADQRLAVSEAGKA
jgi:hypothetical protein